MFPSRADLRRQLRKQRRELDERQRRQAARALARNAMRGGILRRHRRIAFYLPADGEIDILPLLVRASSIGRQCYLPVLDPLRTSRLWFMPYRPGDALVLNHFGIGEPALGARERVPAADLDLVLMPLLAFDDSGNRLGMGGGYYDRTLAFLRTRRSWRRPALCGVAYSFQRVTALQAEPWDVPLDGCLTEQGVHLFHPHARRNHR
jgi:5-formyltetrahydrofolate cyclo-ligase